VPTATPDPVAGLTIPDLRALPYGEGEISIGQVYINWPGYTTYRFSYPAGGKKLTSPALQHPCLPLACVLSLA
jgi:hypothetical protein